MKTLLSIIILTLLTACGGGGGGDDGGGGGDDFWGDWGDDGGGGGDTTPPPEPYTPEPYTPDLDKSYSLSAMFPSDPTTIPDFELEGSFSTEGRTYDITGSLSLDKYPSYGVSVAASIRTTLVTTVFEQGEFDVVTIGSSYYDERDYLLSTENERTGTTCNPAFPYKLPDTVQTGDFRNFPDLDCSDGSTLKSSWRIIGAATNDDIFYVLDSTAYNQLGRIAYTETQQIRFSPDGKILSYKSNVTQYDPYITMTIESI